MKINLAANPKGSAAEKRTAAVMNDPKSTPAQKLAAEAERDAGKGTWTRDLEAGA